MKLCRDSQCERKGELLPLSEFDRDGSRKDGLSHHCKQCKSRRAKEKWRASKDPELQRKPNERVYSAIIKGFRTREQIELATKLDEDIISDSLAELWDRDQVRIIAGEFHPRAA